MPPMRKKMANVLGLHLIAALSQHKIEAVQWSKKSFDQPSFQIFVFQAIEIIKREYEGEFKGIVLFIDNSPIHRSGQFMDKCYSEGINIIYSLPATPEINPIELVFGDLKAPVRNELLVSKSGLLPILEKSLKELAYRPGTSYIRRMIEEIS